LLLTPTITTLQKLQHECEHELYLIDMAINCEKSASLHVSQRHDTVYI